MLFTLMDFHDSNQFKLFWIIIIDLNDSITIKLIPGVRHQFLNRIHVCLCVFLWIWGLRGGMGFCGVESGEVEIDREIRGEWDRRMTQTDKETIKSNERERCSAEISCELPRWSLSDLVLLSFSLASSSLPPTDENQQILFNLSLQLLFIPIIISYQVHCYHDIHWFHSFTDLIDVR